MVAMRSDNLQQGCSWPLVKAEADPWLMTLCDMWEDLHFVCGLVWVVGRQCLLSLYKVVTR